MFLNECFYLDGMFSENFFFAYNAYFFIQALLIFEVDDIPIDGFIHIVLFCRFVTKNGRILFVRINVLFQLSIACFA